MLIPGLPSSKDPVETPIYHPISLPHPYTRMASSTFHTVTPGLALSNVPPSEYEPPFEPNRHLPSFHPRYSPLLQVTPPDLPRVASVIPPGYRSPSVQYSETSFTPRLSPSHLPTSAPSLSPLPLPSDEIPPTPLQDIITTFNALAVILFLTTHLHPSSAT